MKNASNKLITVYSSSNLYELEIIKGKLESEGIQSFIADQNMYTIGFTQEYRLQIYSYDVLKAKVILNKIKE